MASTEGNSPLPEEEQRRILESWARLGPLADLFALTLYRRLFETAPHLRNLFHTDIGTQSRRVFEAFTGAVDSLGDWGRIRPILSTMGRRHAYAGVVAGDFEFLRRALHRTLEDLLGPAYPDEDRIAWDRFFRAVSEEMVSGLRSVESEAKGCDTTRFFRDRGTPPV
jgi:nitric oxide dioxygenase